MSRTVKEIPPMGHNMDARRTSTTQATAAAKAMERAIATNPHTTADGKRRLFVDTGRLAREIAIDVDGKAVNVVGPPGYLEDDDMMDRLIDAVPVVGDPFSDPAVEEAWQQSVDDAVSLVPVRRR